MSTPIEAKSISSISWLLANPPQYPRNPTHEAHHPLILYIVRVPGSKDVFLTPVRPPTKASISLEAIQSSLYFLHVETPADGVLKRSIEEEQRKEEAKNVAQPVFRKPLPPIPHSNYPATKRPAVPSKSYPEYQPPGIGANGLTQAERFVARGSHLRLRIQNVTGVRRRPIGARPQHSEADSRRINQDSDSFGLDKSTAGIRRKPLNNVNASTQRSEVAVIHEESVDDASSIVDDKSADSDMTITPLNESDETTRITLIRRDPASGNQWNVGTICIATNADVTTTIKPVEVVLTTPGYGRFNHHFHRSSEIEQSVTLPEITDDHHRSYSVPVNNNSSSTMFKREVAFLASANNHKSPAQPIRTLSDEVLTDISNGVSKKTRHVLGFTSPWDGLCTFSNGIDGRTIKCRHSLPTSNPTSDALAAPVAEVRFNLPWSVLGTRNMNSQIGEDERVHVSEAIGKSAKEQFRRSIQQFKHTSWHTKSSIDELQENQRPKSFGDIQKIVSNISHEDGGLDLRLGREKAGGGMKGNSAKLGKLIIEDEGLKMCDLVVGACMGVWWQHYTDGMSH